MILGAWSIRVEVERKRIRLHSFRGMGSETTCGLVVPADGTWDIRLVEPSEVNCRACLRVLAGKPRSGKHKKKKDGGENGHGK